MKRESNWKPKWSHWSAPPLLRWRCLGHWAKQLSWIGGSSCRLGAVAQVVLVMWGVQPTTPKPYTTRIQRIKKYVRIFFTDCILAMAYHGSKDLRRHITRGCSQKMMDSCLKRCASDNLKAPCWFSTPKYCQWKGDTDFRSYRFYRYFLFKNFQINPISCDALQQNMAEGPQGNLNPNS